MWILNWAGACANSCGGVLRSYGKSVSSQVKTNALPFHEVASGEAEAADKTP